MLASYYNRPMFPESCRDATINNKTRYNTVIRVAGSWAAYGPVFRNIMDSYGWRRAVLLSDTEVATCLYGVQSVYDELNALIDEYYVYWIRMSDDPIDSELVDYLEQIERRSRSLHFSLRILLRILRIFRIYVTIYTISFIFISNMLFGEQPVIGPS